MSLKFRAHFGGSLKAVIDDDVAYYVLPVAGGYQPKLANGGTWVWVGDVATGPQAEQQAEDHHRQWNENPSEKGTEE